ncbi:unnamed protein product [Chilo suppressalis]|uniref:BZIP domain-containing protein n=1 Tax=Chilo suppressalis TaxID=168631 RepID=A0ABN8B3S2_CHISP|nr:unnamed protein product [Chilo suppressalis]
MSTDNDIEIDNGIENVVSNYKVLDVVDQNVMTPINTKRFTFSTPRAVKKKFKPDESRMARNNAIAEYYSSKKLCLDAKMNNIHLENENSKLKKLQLSLNNEKLSFRRNRKT